jgi:hypothetical protein
MDTPTMFCIFLIREGSGSLDVRGFSGHHTTRRCCSRLRNCVNSLAAAVGEPDLYRLLTLHVPNFNVTFLLLRSYQRITQGTRPFWTFSNTIRFYCEELLAPRPTHNLGDHPLSAAREFFFNIFQLPSILEAVPPSSTWGRAMPWWQGPTYHDMLDN